MATDIRDLKIHLSNLEASISKPTALAASFDVAPAVASSAAGTASLVQALDHTKLASSTTLTPKLPQINIYPMVEAECAASDPQEFHRGEVQTIHREHCHLGTAPWEMVNGARGFRS
jgi:hypothetical protein